MDSLTHKIVKYCDHLLNIKNIEDYDQAFNGLQFENSGKVLKIASAVDASLESIQAAKKIQANLLFVHHGLFWGNPLPVTQYIYEKYRLLIEGDIAVYSCHLPLDAHPEIGNNAILAKKFKLTELFQEFELHKTKIGFVGTREIERDAFRQEVLTHFPRCTAMEYGPEKINKVAVCSGGSGAILSQAKSLGVDTIVVGECIQYQYNIAREHQLNVYICGHYATEIFGVDALGKNVAQKFDLPYQFISSECPL